MPNPPPGLEDAAKGRRNVGNEEPPPDQSLVNLIGSGVQGLEAEGRRLADEFGGVSVGLDAAIDDKLEALEEAGQILEDLPEHPPEWEYPEESGGLGSLMDRFGLGAEKKTAEEAAEWLAAMQAREDALAAAMDAVMRADAIDSWILSALSDKGWITSPYQDSRGNWWGYTSPLPKRAEEWPVPRWRKSDKAREELEAPGVDPFPGFNVDEYLKGGGGWKHPTGGYGGLRLPKMPERPGLPPPEFIVAVVGNPMPPAEPTPPDAAEDENLQIGIGGGTHRFGRRRRRGVWGGDIPPVEEPPAGTETTPPDIPEGTVPPVEEDPHAQDELPPDMPEEDWRWLREQERLRRAGR